MLTQEYLKEALDYNPDTGIFTWKARPLSHFNTQHGCNTFKSRFAGTVTGCVNAHGYLVIRINDKLYLAHRLAYMYVHGKLPVTDTDHINHDRLDNKICNLRPVNRVNNMRNASMYKRNKSGFTGVVWDKLRSKWKAQIKVNGANINLGRFIDISGAIKARQEANIKYGFHVNHGKAI